MSAVNENPIKCIEENKLREDLFYRLSVVQLNIPPLTERINDLFFMVSHFINKYNETMNKNIIGIDESVEEIFRKYNWPGNVRELKNVIEGAFNVASSRFIQKRDLPQYLVQTVEGRITGFAVQTPEIRIPNQGISLENTMAEYEVKLIMSAINNSKSFADAAKLLGITKQALNYKLTKYKINRKI